MRVRHAAGRYRGTWRKRRRDDPIIILFCLAIELSRFDVIKT